MNTIYTRIFSALLLSILLSTLQMGCSDTSEPETQSTQSEPAADTSYLDDLAAKQGIELEEADEGNVKVFVNNSNMIGGNNEELKLEQQDSGSGSVFIKNSALTLDLDGVNEL